MRFAARYFSLLFGIFLVLHFLSAGYFYDHIVTYTKFLHFRWELLIEVFRDFTTMHVVFFVVFLVNALFLKKHQRYTIYFAINFILLVTYLKPGSSFNYFIEPYFSLLLISGITILRLYERYQDTSRRNAILTLILFQAFLLFPFERAREIMADPFRHEGYQENSLVNYYVKNSDGIILSQDIAYLIMNKKDPVIINDAFQYMQLYKYGLWDESRVVAMCKNQEFSLVVLGYMLEGIDPLKNCLDRQYRIIESLNTYRLYIPIKH